MDTLYRLAFAYKKTKLWKKLSDGQLFAVALPDGETGYCSVMGALGEHIALALYPGASGLRSYSMLASGLSPAGGVHAVEFALAQDCLMCSFENKDMLRACEAAAVRDYCTANGVTLRGAHAWPRLLRCRPFYLPWTLDEEKDRLAEGLEAALEVARRLETASADSLGLTEGPPYNREIPLLVKTEIGYDWQTVALPPRLELDYPTGGPLYDLLLKRASMKRERAGVWACDVFLLPEPVGGGEDELEDEPVGRAPFFPWVQLVLDVDSGMILDTTLCEEGEDYAEQFPNKLLELMGNHGRPRRMLVENERTAALYRNLAKRVGFPLEFVDRCADLDDALDDFFDHFSPEDGDEADDDSLALPAGAAGLLADLFRSAGDFSGLPHEMLLVMNSLAEVMGPALPEACRELLEQELRDRFS